MQNSYKKYMKYKCKYLNLKGGNKEKDASKNNEKYLSQRNLKGGMYIEEKQDNSFMNIWQKIPTSGKQNCGIFISDIEKDKIMKCVDQIDLKIIEEVNEINKKNHLFPLIYSLIKYKDNYYEIMERLDGDLADIFYKIIPNIVIDEMKLDDNIRKQFMDIIKLKTAMSEFGTVYLDDIIVKSFKDKIYFESFEKFVNENINNKQGARFDNKYFFTYDMMINYLTKIKKLKEFNEYIKGYSIDPKIFEAFIVSVMNAIKEVYNDVVQGIKFIKDDLYELGYEYLDNKFSNYGYKASAIRHSFNDIMILGQYYTFYFIDWDSGLQKYDVVHSTHAKEWALNKINEEYKNKYRDYAVYGHMPLKYYLHPVLISLDEETYILPKNFLDISDELYQILTKRYIVEL